jgi:chromosome condensin MukBEF ATPase and DNA-binding subunit MukB
MKENQRKKYIQKIIELVDENEDQRIKISFYSDEYVMNIMNKLYQKWNENQQKGIPLDYTTDEELLNLYKRALYYQSKPAQYSYDIMYKERPKEKHRMPTAWDRFKEIFRRLFIGGG